LMMLLVTAGSFVSASAGFGFAIVLVAVLQFFLDPVPLVGMIIILGCSAAGLRVIETRKIPNWKHTLYFIVPAFFGVPLGVAVLKFIDPMMMKRYLNIVLVSGVLMMAYSTNLKNRLRPKPAVIEKGNLLDAVVGFVSGFLGGSCTLSGPPIVMWCVFKGLPKIEMHALWARFFFSIAIFALLNLSVHGMYNRDTVIVSFCLLPAVFAGFRLGIWVRDKMPEERFRFYVLGFLLLSGLTGFVMSFR